MDLMTAAQLESPLGLLRDTRLSSWPIASRISTCGAGGRGWPWNWFRGRKETVGIEWSRPASGLVTALDPVMRAGGGTWIAHGSGSADRETADARGRLRVPPDQPSYTLRRIWLTPEEEQGYYYGWPTTRCGRCATSPMRGRSSTSGLGAVREVNRRFADAVIEEVGDDRAVVFVQDYHFALLPRFVKEARPDVTVCQFWHIPWPNREAFRVCPWGEEILQGLLGNDLLGFHVQYHCNNFLDTVDRALESRVDYEHFAVWRGGRPTFVRPFPISIDPVVVERPGQARRPAAETAGAPDARAGRREDDLRRRSARLHEGHSRSPESVRPAARAASGMAHPRDVVQVGAPSRDI